MNIDEAPIYRVTNEVCTDVNMFHTGMRLWIMGTGNGTLVVAIQRSGLILRKAKFVEKWLEPEDLVATM